MSELEKTRKLLLEVFPSEPKFRNIEYLEWLYSGPAGGVIRENQEDHEGLVAHYAVVPQWWSVHGERELWALSLNTAVLARAQGKGLFTRLAKETFSKAKSLGIEKIIGVANANSTPGFVGTLGFGMLGKIPVSVMPFRAIRGSKGIDRVEVRTLLATDFQLLRPSDSEVVSLWDKETIEWRLSCPYNSFAIFQGDGFYAITKKASWKSVSISVILKLLTMRQAPEVDLTRVAAACCRHHRTPFALYAGYGERFQQRGMLVPEGLRPSPLNLIIKDLSSQQNKTLCGPSHFEFLEFDAF